MASVVTSSTLYPSNEKSPPNICTGCGVEFGPDVDLFPPVAVTKEHQAARKLMENPPEEKLCPDCFMEHLKSLSTKVLAATIAGLVKANMDLRKRTITAIPYYPKEDTQWKPLQPYTITSTPHTIPGTVSTPQWDTTTGDKLPPNVTY